MNRLVILWPLQANCPCCKFSDKQVMLQCGLPYVLVTFAATCHHYNNWPPCSTVLALLWLPWRGDWGGFTAEGMRAVLSSLRDLWSWRMRKELEIGVCESEGFVFRHFSLWLVFFVTLYFWPLHIVVGLYHSAQFFKISNLSCFIPNTLVCQCVISISPQHIVLDVLL